MIQWNTNALQQKLSRQVWRDKLKEHFFNTYTFNKFIVLFQKGVYPYEYMNDWKMFNETPLPKKENFNIHLNMEDINGADYVHSKIVWNKKYRIISWFVISKWYIIVSRYISELSKSVPWNIWAWSCKISYSSRISMESSFKKTNVKLDLLTDIDRLLMVEKGVRGGVRHSICQYTKANSK